MNILITGGLGFIGTKHPRLKLHQKKMSKKILIIDSFQETSLKNIKSFAKYKYYNSVSSYKESDNKISIVRGNIKNSNFALKLTKNIDYIVHLAAESGVDISIRNPENHLKITFLVHLII